jgi:hypothetical protein
MASDPTQTSPTSSSTTTEGSDEIRKFRQAPAIRLPSTGLIHDVQRAWRIHFTALALDPVGTAASSAVALLIILMFNYVATPYTGLVAREIVRLTLVFICAGEPSLCRAAATYFQCHKEGSLGCLVDHYVWLAFAIYFAMLWLLLTMTIIPFTDSFQRAMVKAKVKILNREMVYMLTEAGFTVASEEDKSGGKHEFGVCIEEPIPLVVAGWYCSAVDVPIRQALFIAYERISTKLQMRGKEGCVTNIAIQWKKSEIGGGCYTADMIVPVK